jgi:hypothetical protein
MPPVGFEPAIPASKRPQTYALDRAANGIGALPLLLQLFIELPCLLSYSSNIIAQLNSDQSVGCTTWN